MSVNIPCPHCRGLRTKVVDSREARLIVGTRRRRKCTRCGKRFTTIETYYDKVWEQKEELEDRKLVMRFLETKGDPK